MLADAQTKRKQILGCCIILGFLLGVGFLADWVNTSSQAATAATDTAAAERTRLAALEAARVAEAAFSALPPQTHLDAVTNSLNSSNCTDVAHHLSKIPEGFPGKAEAKSRFDKLTAKLKAERAAKLKADRLSRAAAEKESERKLHAQWCKEGVRIGMTAERVRLSSWGNPRSINRTISANSTHEQWCYDGGYLYFEDGILTTIQN